MLRATWLVVVVCATAGAAEPVTDSQIADLVRQLGGDTAAGREQATRRLWEIGQPAVPALKQAANSPDLEVRTRAEAILKDVARGVRPDWPAEMIELARGLDAAGTEQKRAGVLRLAQTLKGAALPYLLEQLTVGTAADHAFALDRIDDLAKADPAVYPRVIELVKVPANEFQATALVRAKMAGGQVNGALALMAAHDVNSPERGKLVAQALERLMGMLGKYQFTAAARDAGELTQIVPNDARFLYLHAEALSALGQDAKADELRARALLISPADEGPHYTAGDMLQDMGRRVLAEKEWQAILKIPPADGVYDSNAYLRLHTLYAECGLFKQAAEYLEKAVLVIEAMQKEGGGTGLMGATPEELQQRVQELHARALRQPAGPRTVLRDRRPDGQLQIGVDVSVKDGKDKELREALKTASARLAVGIKPPGMKLFDKGVLVVRYDAAARQVGVFMNDRPVGAPGALDLAGQARRIAIRSEDCYHIYEIAPDGSAKRVARYEKDYRVVFRPGNKIAACTEVTVTINGKSYPWADLLTGVDMDILPDKIHVVVAGKYPDGKPMKLELNTTPKDPAP